MHKDTSGSDNGASNQDNSRAKSRTRTGPRTRAGKARSRLNATKHGLFSKVVVLAHESQAEFDDFLAGFRQDFAPQGTMEEALVERIATLFWRYRRLLHAETAEIQQQLLGQLHRDNERRERQPEAPQPVEIDDEPQSLKAISLLIPEYSHVMERLLRYETHLDRSITRALGHLEILRERRETQNAITI